jgi:hypothetical protein
MVPITIGKGKHMDDLREYYLREYYLCYNHGDLAEAAAHLALALTRDDPATSKAGYSKANAILAACEVFPEIEPGKVVALNTRHGWSILDLPPSAESDVRAEIPFTIVVQGTMFLDDEDTKLLRRLTAEGLDPISKIMGSLVAGALEGNDPQNKPVYPVSDGDVVYEVMPTDIQCAAFGATLDYGKADLDAVIAESKQAAAYLREMGEHPDQHWAVFNDDGVLVCPESGKPVDLEDGAYCSGYGYRYGVEVQIRGEPGSSKYLDVEDGQPGVYARSLDLVVEGSGPLVSDCGTGCCLIPVAEWD